MTFPDLQQIRAAVARDPQNAELRYLLGAELAQQREYDAAVVEMRTALELDPNLHFARLQLGLLYLTMAQPNDSIEIWAPLEQLDERAALKAFKRGLEALIRDDFPACINYLQQGIHLNTQNAPLNRDMSMIVTRVREAGVPVVQPLPVIQTPAGAHTDFALYGDPPTGTKH
jgi:tetratricopeptide (TPR) repeat protein